MRLWELFLIAVGLSMDAFAVSVCKGLSVKKTESQAYSSGRRFLWNLSGADAASCLYDMFPVPVLHSQY